LSSFAAAAVLLGGMMLRIHVASVE